MNYQLPQRQKILKIIRTWINICYEDDFLHSPELESRLKEFLISTAAPSGLVKLSKILFNELKLQKNLLELKSKEKMKINLRDRAENEGFLSISNLSENPAKFASQLTIYEFKQFYAKFKFSDFLHKNWTKKNNSRNLIVKFTEHFNAFTKYYINAILFLSTEPERANLIRRLILLSVHFLKLNNFNGIFQIVSALNHFSVKRLTNSWNLIEANFIFILQLFAILLQNKMLLYRTLWDNAQKNLPSSQTPAVPYLGLFLNDLIFLEDGNLTFFSNPEQPSEKIINLKKLKKIKSIIDSLLFFQKLSYSELADKEYFYCFKLIHKNFVSSTNTLENQESLWYDLSVCLEPSNDSESSGNPFLLAIEEIENLSFEQITEQINSISSLSLFKTVTLPYSASDDQFQSLASSPAEQTPSLLPRYSMKSFKNGWARMSKPTLMGSLRCNSCCKEYRW